MFVDEQNLFRAGFYAEAAAFALIFTNYDFGTLESDGFRHT
ncbi:MAG: hypothetical protein BWY77_01256 [bacterium ADurb.Bin431]|nr:MAG: hypothetical protein BWY77_01256 [bacterium ADurb.Bin431]